MITEHHVEQDGDRVLWRITTDGSAALDVLTNRAILVQARLALSTVAGNVLLEEPLGTFGPFTVTMSSSDHERVAIAVDGPDLGPGFRGNQAVVFYFTRDELLAALQGALPAPAA